MSLTFCGAAIQPVQRAGCEGIHLHCVHIAVPRRLNQGFAICLIDTRSWHCVIGANDFRVRLKLSRQRKRLRHGHDLDRQGCARRDGRRLEVPGLREPVFARKHRPIAGTNLPN